MGAGKEKQQRAARRRDCTLEVARLGAQKEMDDIRDWWKVEAKRVKDELYSKICDSVGTSPFSTALALWRRMPAPLPCRSFPAADASPSPSQKRTDTCATTCAADTLSCLGECCTHTRPVGVSRNTDQGNA